MPGLYDTSSDESWSPWLKRSFESSEDSSDESDFGGQEEEHSKEAKTNIEEVSNSASINKCKASTGLQVKLSQINQTSQANQVNFSASDSTRNEPESINTESTYSLQAECHKKQRILRAAEAEKAKVEEKLARKSRPCPEEKQ